MKKLKIALSAAGVVAVLGTAFALNSSKVTGRVVYYSTTAKEACDFQINASTLTETDDVRFQAYATTNANSDCLQLHTIYEIAE